MFRRSTKTIAMGIVAISLICATSVNGQTTSTNGLFGTNAVGGSTASRAPTSSTAARTTTGSATSGTTGAAGGTGGTNTQNVAITAMQNMAGGTVQTQPPGSFIGADRSDATNLRSLQAPHVRGRMLL